MVRDSRRADAATVWWLEWYQRVKVEGIPRDDKVVAVAHPANGLSDLGFVILDDFDSLEALEGMSVYHHLGPVERYTQSLARNTTWPCNSSWSVISASLPELNLLSSN